MVYSPIMANIKNDVVHISPGEKVTIRTERSKGMGRSYTCIGSFTPRAGGVELPLLKSFSKCSPKGMQFYFYVLAHMDVATGLCAVSVGIPEFTTKNMFYKALEELIGHGLIRRVKGSRGLIQVNPDHVLPSKSYSEITSYERALIGWNDNV